MEGNEFFVSILRALGRQRWGWRLSDIRGYTENVFSSLACYCIRGITMFYSDVFVDEAHDYASCLPMCCYCSQGRIPIPPRNGVYQLDDLEREESPTRSEEQTDAHRCAGSSKNQVSRQQKFTGTTVCCGVQILAAKADGIYEIPT